MEAGKKGLLGYTVREATLGNVEDPKKENDQFEQLHLGMTRRPPDITDAILFKICPWILCKAAETVIRIVGRKIRSSDKVPCTECAHRIDVSCCFFNRRFYAGR